MTLPFGEPITVITKSASGRDTDGSATYTETSTTVNGGFDPAIGFESIGGRDTVVTQPQALLPYGTTVAPTSVLVIRGDRYEVDGTPNPWRNVFTGTKFGIAVPLRRVTG